MKRDRIVLKLSGEALAGEAGTGFCEEIVRGVAKQVAEIVKKGAQVAVVIGGGNFWRGRSSEGMDRVKADQIGMLATVMNAIYTADMFRQEGMKCHVMTPLPMANMTEQFVRDQAVRYLKKGHVVFFAGGTGHPYFSTDMAVVLRAIEVEADCILAAKAIDGVYTADPKKDPDAKKIDKLSMQDIVDKKLGVIDLASAVLAMENHMPMLLFGLAEKNSIVNAVCGKFTGTEITAE